MAYSLESIYLSLLGSLNRFFSVVFSLSIVCLLILFGLQLKHPPWLDSLWPIVQLHRWGDPLLGATWAASASMTRYPLKNTE